MTADTRSTSTIRIMGMITGMDMDMNMDMGMGMIRRNMMTTSITMRTKRKHVTTITTTISKPCQ